MSSPFLRSLTRVKLIVFSFLLKKLVVSSALDDPALLQNDYAVGVFDGRQPVGDNEGSPSLHQLIHALLYHFFGTGVDRAGRLVEYQRRRIGDRGARDREQLALSGASQEQIYAVTLDDVSEVPVPAGPDGGNT